ncbi:MAG: phosphohydrolase [Anaerocolumna sp.]|jgi:8-oxo-dGTP pyrophosphatase MutT (NUDIX family)|nr:phosphohydrolase [Anaerocolumna sp.]
MIHVNARAILIQLINTETHIVIQKRLRHGEPEYYELPGGRIEEFESITDAVRREVYEETGLTITEIENEDTQLITNNDNGGFSIQCIKPFTSYQTIHGPVDSFGVYFICKASGQILEHGDGSTDVHWASMNELKELLKHNKFSDIDKAAVMLFIRDRISSDSNLS